MIKSFLPSGEPVVILQNDESFDESAIVIRSSASVTEKPPWQPMQFLQYESEEFDGRIVVRQEVYSFDHGVKYQVTHSYSRSGEACVEYKGYPSEKIPIRYLGDGFAPWGLQCRALLTLHASCVRFGNDVLIFLGGHDSGKSTAAQMAVVLEEGELVSDDQLFVSFSSKGEIQVAPAFWDEAVTQRVRLTANKVNILVLDDGVIEEATGSTLELSLGMTLMQFVVGAYCSPESFDAGQQLIESLIAVTSLCQLGPRPAKEELVDILRLRRRGGISLL